MKKKNIEVSYDGEYPCTCMGRLVVKVDQKVVYNEEFCCSSSGSVSFDKD